MSFKIKKEILQATIQYLSTKPYAEVVNLIRELSKAEEVTENRDIKDIT